MTISAPAPKELAQTLRSLAAVLEQHGSRAVELAPLLAARGWPTSTIGTGSRSSSELTSVEAAVDRPNVDWNDVDTKLARTLHDVWVQALDVRTLITSIVSHAEPDQRRAANQRATTERASDCLACTRPVAGTADDRLRAGYCDACRKAWERAGRPDRALFQRRRRAELTEAET